MKRSILGWIVFLSTIVTVFVSCQSESSTGFRYRVTKKGLKYASQTIVELLMKNLPTADIPDLYDRLGSMSIVLSNVTIMNFSRPTLEIELVPNTATSFGGQRYIFSYLDPTIESNMKMTYESWLFSTTRELFVTIATINLTVTVEVLVGTDDAGNTVPGAINCRMDGIVHMASKEDDTFSGLFDFMTSSLNEQLKQTMFYQACNNITTMINASLQNQMSAANMSRVKVDDNYFLDLKFATTPKVTRYYLENSHTGVVYGSQGSSGVWYPTNPHKIPDFSDHRSKMGYAYLTDWIFNKAWDTALRNGDLRYSFNSSAPDLPKAFRRYLSISCNNGSLCLGSVFPKLRENLYRHSVIQVELKAAEPAKPVVRFRGRTIDLRIPVSGDFFAKTTHTKQPIVSVSMTVIATLQVNVSNERVFCNSAKFSVNLNTTNIHLNDVSSSNSKFQSFMKTASRRFVIPYLKDLASKGYPLQIPSASWLKFVNPVVITSRKSGFIVLGTDFSLDVKSTPGTSKST